MRESEMIMLKWMNGLTIEDKISNECIGVASIVDKMKQDSWYS